MTLSHVENACTRSSSPQPARRPARLLPAVIASFLTLATALTCAVPALAAGEADRERSTAWSSVFEVLRPLQPVDTHRVIVLFDAPSLAEWSAAADQPL